MVNLYRIAPWLKPQFSQHNSYILCPVGRIKARIFVHVLGRGKRIFKARCVWSRVFRADLSTINHLNAKLITSTLETEQRAFRDPQFAYISVIRIFKSAIRYIVNWCGSRNARCAVSKVEKISLAFKCLIVLRSAINTRDQTQRVRLPRPETGTKWTFASLVHRLLQAKLHVNQEGPELKFCC